MSYEVQWSHKIRPYQYSEICLCAPIAHPSFLMHSDLSFDFALASYSSYLMMHKKIVQ